MHFSAIFLHLIIMSAWPSERLNFENKHALLNHLILLQFIKLNMCLEIQDVSYIDGWNNNNNLLIYIR